MQGVASVWHCKTVKKKKGDRNQLQSVSGERGQMLGLGRAINLVILFGLFQIWKH